MKLHFFKTGLLLLALFSFVFSFAQTKEETEKWILEKLNYYKDESDYITTISFNNGYFEVLKTVDKRKRYNHAFQKFRFPIWSIDVVSFWEKWIEFNLQNYCDECTFETHYSFSKRVSQISITLKIKDPEKNFTERFNKAIQHLKTFYPKPEKQKDTF